MADTNTYALATPHTLMSISGADGTGDYSAGVRLACVGGAGGARFLHGRIYALYGTSNLPSDLSAVQTYLDGMLP